MQFFLQKHAQTVAHHQIKVNLTREGRKVVIDFQVQKRDASAWLTDPKFSQDWTQNWGLWNHDVVEVFLQLRKTADDLKAPYLEIQVSPANQPFALIITEPRKTFFPPAILDFKTSVETSGRSFTAHMEVLLPAELSGELLFGGAFACLSQNPREYFALEVNPEVNPDFHRPELFQALDE